MKGKYSSCLLNPTVRKIIESTFPKSIEFKFSITSLWNRIIEPPFYDEFPCQSVFVAKELEMSILNYLKSKGSTQKPKQRFDFVKASEEVIMSLMYAHLSLFFIVFTSKRSGTLL